MAENGWNGWKQLEMAGTGRKWLTMDENGLKLLETTEMAEIC